MSLYVILTCHLGVTQQQQESQRQEGHGTLEHKELTLKHPLSPYGINMPQWVNPWNHTATGNVWDAITVLMVNYGISNTVVLEIP